MTSQDFIENLKRSEGILSIFTDPELLNKYDLTIVELLDAIKEYLSDNEKRELLKTQAFKTCSVSIKSNILESITDANVKKQIIDDDEIMSGFDRYDKEDLIKNSNAELKKLVLADKDTVKKLEMSSTNIENLIFSLESDSIAELLAHPEHMTKNLSLDGYTIASLIAKLEGDKAKLDAMQLYNLSSSNKARVIENLEYKNKVETLVNDSSIERSEIIRILSTLDTDELISFIKNSNDFFEKREVEVYSITRSLTEDAQIEFAKKIDETGLSLAEKKQILLCFNEEVKENLSKEDMPKEYKAVLSIKLSEEYGGGKIDTIDFSRNLEDYFGLDEFLCIHPDELDDEERKKILLLFDICPNMKLYNRGRQR